MNTTHTPTTHSHPAGPGAETTHLAAEVAALRAAVLDLTRSIAPRLTREQMLERRAVSRNTLTRQIETGLIPRPGKDGKWLRSEVMEWEAMERARKAA